MFSYQWKTYESQTNMEYNHQPSGKYDDASLQHYNQLSSAVQITSLHPERYASPHWEGSRGDRRVMLGKCFSSLLKMWLNQPGKNEQEMLALVIYTMKTQRHLETLHKKPVNSQHLWKAGCSKIYLDVPKRSWMIPNMHLRLIGHYDKFFLQCSVSLLSLKESLGIKWRAD